jgi:hypothetical protein
MPGIAHTQRGRGLLPKRGLLTPPARCNHDYPILLLATNKARRGFCLGCQSVGPVRESPRAAQLALISTCT